MKAQLENEYDTLADEESKALLDSVCSDQRSALRWEPTIVKAKAYSMNESVEKNDELKYVSKTPKY